MKKYVSIRGVKTKKVYWYQTLDQLQIILDEYPLCEHMVFFENEEEEAMEWAGAQKIEKYHTESMKEKIVQNSRKYIGHPFKELLGKLAKQNYTHVKIKMSNGDEFMMFIRNFIMVKGTCYANFSVMTKTQDNCENDEIVFSHLEGVLGQKNSGLFSQPMRIITFDDMNKMFDKCWDNSRYIERDKCLYMFLKSGIFGNDSYGNKLFSCSRIFCSGFEMFGDIVNIDFSFKELYGADSGEIYRYDDKKENFSFNVNQISSLTPLSLPRAVTDKDWITAITTLIEDGFSIFSN